MISSFYFHESLNFVLSKIYLEKHVISIKKIQSRNRRQSNGTLWAFNPKWDFHKFIKSCNLEVILVNQKKLPAAIKLFNQAILVSGNSGFLIRFNIIELCMGGSQSTKAKFKSILSDNEREQKYEFALYSLLDTIDESDHSEFINKWQGIKRKLDYRPMNSPIKEFLIGEKLPIDKFPITIERLKKIRDYLTHGSISSIKKDEIEKANILLYRISGILILNLMGVSDWNFDTDFN
jgi:hypothetical protein